MRFMSPHLMMTLGASVSGTVDSDYDANWLCDGDPSFPIRTTTSASYTITGSSTADIDGIVVANHNLDAGTNVVFSSGLTATVVADDVPPNDIRLNAFATITPATASGCTLTITGHSGPIVIGEVLIGQFQEMRTLPPSSNLSMVPFEVPNAGEFGGLSQDRGAESRVFGGTVYVDEATKGLLDDWYRACRNNSLPSVIVPIEATALISPGPLVEAWVVKWITYSPRPYLVALGQWEVEVAWQELPRYRWP